MKKIAYKEMFENELTHPWYQRTRLLMINVLKKTLNKKSIILDVGCGTGGTIAQLKNHGFNNVFGIESSNMAISFCKKRGLKNIILSRAENIPYPSNNFDAVICLDVLYHQGLNRKKVIQEIKRVLKPGGLFYSQEPAFNWLKSRHDLAIETDKRFTKSDLRQLLNQSEFKIIKLHYYNSLLFPVFVAKRIIDKFSLNKKVHSDVTSLNPVLSWLLSVVLSFETNISNYNFEIPFGLTLISVSKK